MFPVLPHVFDGFSWGTLFWSSLPIAIALAFAEFWYIVLPKRRMSRSCGRVHCALFDQRTTPTHILCEIYGWGCSWKILFRKVKQSWKKNFIPYVSQNNECFFKRQKSTIQIQALMNYGMFVILFHSFNLHIPQKSLKRSLLRKHGLTKPPPKNSTA